MVQVLSAKNMVDATADTGGRHQLWLTDGHKSAKVLHHVCFIAEVPYISKQVDGGTTRIVLRWPPRERVDRSRRRRTSTVDGVWCQVFGMHTRLEIVCDSNISFSLPFSTQATT